MREDWLMAKSRNLATGRALSRSASTRRKPDRPFADHEAFRDTIELERIRSRQRGRVAMLVDVEVQGGSPRQQRRRLLAIQSWTASLERHRARAGWLDGTRCGVLIHGESVGDLLAEVQRLCDTMAHGEAVRCWVEHDAMIPERKTGIPCGRMPELFSRPPARWKRGVDILFAVGCLAVFAPLLFAVLAGVLVTDGRPIFFGQFRVGRGGKPFYMYKIRTMSRDAETRKAELLDYNELDGLAFKMQHDPRVTKIGYWLRKLSIDELPQLWNVIRGDMSIVGPRPLPVADWEPTRAIFCRRHDVNPGITCTWQVSGRCRVSFDKWMEMDLEYARSVTFWRDALLVLQTFPAVVSQHGAA
jgi:lipopolysaccharide/colanic/teichoic acid biosynthesis glycosyltransferase